MDFENDKVHDAKVPYCRYAGCWPLLLPQAKISRSVKTTKSSMQRCCIHGMWAAGRP